MRKNMLKIELKQACKDAAAEPGNAVKLSNGWFVTVFREYPLPARPGPAWYLIYKLCSPTGKSFGGMKNRDNFASYFSNPRGWQWRDDYTANGFGKAVSA